MDILCIISAIVIAVGGDCDYFQFAELFAIHQNQQNITCADTKFIFETFAQT
ncbi:MAG: hypothetical protein ACR2L1_04935 [Pyrinomonadaceae bacterium]